MGGSQIWRRTASRWKNKGILIAIKGIVDEASLFGGRLRLESTLSTTTDSNRFEITDVVHNLGSDPPRSRCFTTAISDARFLERDLSCTLLRLSVVPRNDRAAEGINMWILLEGPTTGFAEQVYFAKAASDPSGWGMAVLTDAESQHAVCVRFDTSTMPFFVLWKNTQPEADGYVAGLEPGSSFPNLRTVERREGRVIQLAAGQSVTFRLSMEVASNRRDVRNLLDEVTALQVATPRIVHSSPKPQWV